MSARDGVRMGDGEVAGFLGDHLKVQVASIGRDGAPHLTTLFYVVLDGRIAFWTYARSQKIRNLERDPRVSALVEDGTDYFELRGVSITGTRRARPRPRPGPRDRTAVAVRMVGAAVATTSATSAATWSSSRWPSGSAVRRPSRPRRELGPPQAGLTVGRGVGSAQQQADRDVHLPDRRRRRRCGR